MPLPLRASAIRRRHADRRCHMKMRALMPEAFSCSSLRHMSSDTAADYFSPLFLPYFPPAKMPRRYAVFDDVSSAAL